MTYPFYTIGHGTRPIGDFAELLRSAVISVVVDVRTVPRSRTNPQYNRDVLPQLLAPYQIAYEHVAALGGLRAKDRSVPFDVNAFWANESFHNYADYAMSETFRDGLRRLRGLGAERCCVVMCAETVWWRCHRRIIADYLLAAGDAVFHILGPRQVEPAHMSETARPGPAGILTYPGGSTPKPSAAPEQRP